MKVFKRMAKIARYERGHVGEKIKHVGLLLVDGLVPACDRCKRVSQTVGQVAQTCYEKNNCKGCKEEKSSMRLSTYTNRWVQQDCERIHNIQHWLKQKENAMRT